MKEVLEPLSQVAGVRLAVLILADGVPVVAPRCGRVAEQTQRAGNGFAELEAASGLCVGWLSEITRSVAPLSWEAPERAVLRAARGSLIVRRVGDVILLVVLEAGLAPEELRLPVEAAAARLGRVLRDLAAPLPAPQPTPPAMPSSPAVAAAGATLAHRSNQDSPVVREARN
jgi:predicted regulator of Ras-like GTPase activity (Roadblock/LC7/MglB family)